MKKLIPFACALALAATPAAMGQNEAVSNPVGYETVNYNAGFNYLGLRLVGTQAGASTVSAISGTTITLADAATPGDYVVEITSGTFEGAVVTGTVASNGTTLTTSDDLSSAVVIGNGVSLREEQTLASVFGENNSAGLASTASFNTSDQIWVPDGTGDFSRYAYVQGSIILGTTTGWQDASGTAVTPSEIDLVYTDGIILNAASNGSFIAAGSVKTGRTILALTAQFNYISSIYPVGTTLDEANLETTLTSTASFNTSDQIWIPTGTGQFARYAYVQGSIILGTTTGWQDASGNSVDATLITFDNSSGAIIVRAGNADRNITLNPPTSYQNL